MIAAESLLAAACEELGWRLADLVARCAVWAHPDVVTSLRTVDSHATWFPNHRRARTAMKETPGTKIGGVRLDNNTYANLAIKRAIYGKSKDVVGYHACHVWPGSCYDTRYHTSIANLVLLPAPLAGLSDYDHGVMAALRFRSQDLYGWRPEGEVELIKPDHYPGPTAWRAPEPPTSTVLSTLRRRRRVQGC